MKRRYSKALKIFRYFLLLMFALFIAMLLLPFFFQDELKETVREYLNTRVSAQVDFEDIHLSALKRFPKLSLSVEKLLISTKDHKEQDSIFFAKDLILELPIYSLWQKNKAIEITQLDLDEALLSMRIDSLGRRNYDIFSSQNQVGSATPLAFELKEFNIRNANIRYQDELSGLQFYLQKIEHSGSGDFSKSNFNLESSTVIDRFKYVQNNVAIIEQWQIRLEGDLQTDLEKNQFAFEKFRIWINQLPLNVQGLFRLDENATFCDIQLNSEQNEFLQYVSLLPNTQSVDLDKIKAKGTANLSAYIKGDLDPANEIFPEFEIQSKLENGYVQFPGFSIPIKDINGELWVQHSQGTLDATVLKLQNFMADLNGEPLKANLRATHLRSDPLLDLRLEGKLKLKDFASAYPMPAIHQLDGLIDTRISILARQSQLQNADYQQVNFEGQMNGQSIFIDTGDKQYSIPSFGVDWNKDQMNIAAFSLKQGNTDFFIEGSVQKPLDIFIDQKVVKATLDIDAKRFDANQYINRADSLKIERSLPFWAERLKMTNINVAANVGELNYDHYKILNTKFKGRYTQDQLFIDECTGFLSGSDYSMNGILENVIAYQMENDTISGLLTLNSKMINSNQFLEDQKQPSIQTSAYPLLPERTSIEVMTSAEKIQYGRLNIADVSGKILMKGKLLELRTFEAGLFDGKIGLEGTYTDQGMQAPEFALRYEMKSIPFKTAYNSLQGFQKFAPVFSFIEGIFNASLIMNGNLNEKLLPQLASLTAAGFVETNDAQINSIPYLEKLDKFFTANMKEVWDLNNTKNWFDIEKGTFTLQEYKRSWKDMEFSIAGTHSLDQQVNYLIKAKVPKSKLNQSAIGQQVNQAVDQWVQKAVDQGILKLKEEPYILLDFSISGNIKNPMISVKPKGISGMELVNPVSGIIEQQKSELKDKAEEKVEKLKSEIEETVQQKTAAAKDSLQKVLDQAAGQAISKGKDKAQTLLDSTLKEQVSQALPDSLKEQFGKTLEDLFDQKSKEEVQNKLKDFNPFKKKKKNN